MACVISNSETNVINAANSSIGKIKRCSLADKDYFYHCMVTFCRCRFKTKEDLKYHQTCHNLEGKNFKCPQCYVVHGCWNDMKCHLWKEHSVDIDLITCGICGYKTDCVSKLESHKLCHGIERAFSCDQCDKSFKQAGSLRNHMLCHVARQDKTTKHKVECEVCHLFFLNRSVLRKHKSNEHGQVEFYSCTECVYSTESLHQFQRHIQKHVEKVYECDQCDFKTKRSNNLKEHLMTHTGEKPYHCHLCCYATIRLHHFKLHLKKYHPENAGLFECSLCIFTTLNYEKFLKHVNNHKGSNSQESINNKSQVLNKTLLLKDSSQVSLDFQNKKDQKFVCHLCNFETKRKDTFKSHTMKHTGKKPYKCLFCNYTAIQASHYKLHIQKQHPDKSAILQCNFCIFSTYKFDTYEKHVQSHSKGSKEILLSENNNLLKDANNEVIIDLRNPITFSVSDIGNNSLIANMKFNEDFELAKVNMLQMKNKTFKCAYCSFSFLKLLNYKEHLKIYHNRQSGLFKCNSCSFQTLIFSQFLKHQDIHKEHCDNHPDVKEEINSEDNSQEDCDHILLEQCSENVNPTCQLPDGLETTIIPIHPLLLNLETAVADASSSVLLLTIPKEECDQF